MTAKTRASKPRGGTLTVLIHCAMIDNRLCALTPIERQHARREPRVPILLWSVHQACSRCSRMNSRLRRLSAVHLADWNLLLNSPPPLQLHRCATMAIVMSSKNKEQEK